MDRFATIALDVFPPRTEQMPYNSSIDALETTRFHYCPLDFCRAVHEALRIIQNTASKLSYQSQYNATKKVGAKSDHLLSLDDLFDITLVVYLLARVDELPGMVEAFEPYIAGLDMMAELEFAFTNITAIISHIMNLDMNKFISDANEKMHELLDIDPLHILG